VRKQELAVQREQDSILLDYALRKEREKAAEEEAKRNANRQAAQQYKKYLELQMQKEAEDTAFVDEIRKKEEEKVWKARDDALQAREDARQYLMKMVDQGRQEQIRSKYEQMVREREEGKVYSAKFLEDAMEGVALERADIARRRQIAMDNAVKLKDQIAHRAHMAELEKQETYLADKHMKYMERLHQQKLAEQGGSVRLNFPLKENKWYT
jgi:hypothetical protein